jgi:hypothetical protein
MHYQVQKAFLLSCVVAEPWAKQQDAKIRELSMHLMAIINDKEAQYQEYQVEPINIIIG